MVFDENKLTERLEQAFKKLKSSAFFDKTRPILRERLMEYETSSNFRISLSGLASALAEDSGKQWAAVIERICAKISIAVYPKSVSGNGRQQSDSKWKLISNRDTSGPMADKMQLFIDMDAEGFLLGMLWVMFVGFKVDQTFADCSYGNRMRKRVGKDGPFTWSPYVFEPYFSQYEQWRDGALDIAERARNEDEVDVVMLTLDFKSFYYSVDMADSDWKAILDVALASCPNGGEREICSRLNAFVESTVQAYSDLLYGDASDHPNVLPIGFSPSQIVANWCLDRFDQAICSQVNPLFYGRYVDDVLIVDKVESNTGLREKWESGELSPKTVFSHLFRERPEALFEAGYEGGLVGSYEISDTRRDFISDDFEDEVKPRVNPVYLNAPRSRIEVQGEKVKVFYFDKAAPYALIQQFREQIARNSSEFRLMPDIASMSLKDSYKVIYELQSGDSPNKFREVDGISVNSFELSKFLGKCQRLGPLLIGESRQEEFCKELLSLFEPSSIIQYYPTWEKLFEIAISFEDDKMLGELLGLILKAVRHLEVNIEVSDQGPAVAAYAERLGADSLGQRMRLTMLRALSSYLARSMGLVSGSLANKIIGETSDLYERLFSGGQAIQDVVMYASGKSIMDAARISRLRKVVVETYMVDKYAMPVLPHFVMPAFSSMEGIDDASRRLTDFGAVQCALACEASNPWVFQKRDGAGMEGMPPLFPYIVKANDLEYSYYSWVLAKGDDLPSPPEVERFVNEQYWRLNFRKNADGLDSKSVQREAFLLPPSSGEPDRYVVSVSPDGRRATKVRVAIANVELDDSFDEDALRGRPQLTHNRYSDIARLAATAKRAHADYLVFPELCIPYSWLPRLMAFSANNDIAIICGVERVLSSNNCIHRRARNLTAVILPYVEQEAYRFAKLSLHEKVHLAPAERSGIENLGCEPSEGSSFELYCWHGVWFPVYCCFELASIRARAQFSAYADVLFAVEWNRDTNYYSNILGSLARDLSCCCVQVNNSKYGDSRMTFPDRTEKMDTVKVKGGLTPTLLVGEVDIGKIRACQERADGKPYKPPAPDFDREIVRLKVEGGLLERLRGAAREC